MAVAGFRPEERALVVKDNTLVITGRPANEGPKHEVLYRGIAGRAFERRFVLADHIVVDGADLNNGLLHVGLKRVVPEALKPRKIAIGGTAAPTAIANDAAEAAKAAYPTPGCDGTKGPDFRPLFVCGWGLAGA